MYKDNIILGLYLLRGYFVSGIAEINPQKI